MTDKDDARRRVVEENILRGQMAMRALCMKLLTPGIEIAAEPGVPLYWADDSEPGIIIRELDGKVDRGRIENGKFKPEKE